MQQPKRQLGFEKFALILFGLALIAILPLAVAVFPDAYHHHLFLLSRFYLVLGALGIGFGLLNLARWLQRQSASRVRKIALAIAIISVVIQVWLAVCILGDNIYDGMDTRFQVVNLLHGSRRWIPYFHELAENNVPLTLIEYWLLAGFKWLHVNGWIGLNITLFIWLDLTFAMLWQLLKHHLGLAVATVSLLIAAVYFPFYGYALFFYTDGLAVLFPVLTLWLLERYQQTVSTLKRYSLMVVMGVELWLAFWIKGNNAILLIALAIVMLWQHSFGWRKTVMSLAIVGVIFVGGLQVGPKIEQHYGYHQPMTQKMPALTWTMLGWNFDTQGSSSHADTGMVQHQKGYAQKQALIKRTLKQRLLKTSPQRLVYHLIRKLSLMWAYGGLDVQETINQAQHYPKIYQYLYGTKKAWLASWNQVVYLVLMGFNLVAVYFKLRLKQRLNIAERFILLTILGIGAFHMLFWEGEARYVYLILPFLLFGAGTGIQQAIKQPVPQTVVRHQRIWQLGFGTLCVLLLLGGTWQSRALLRPQSQLTPQIMQNKTYGTIRLAKREAVTQGFTLKQSANQVIWQNKTGQSSNQLQVTLEKVGTKQKWQLSQNKTVVNWQLHQKIQPGQYRLRILNRGEQTVKVTLLKSRHYHAIPQMQSLQSNPWQQQYLVLTVGWQQVKPTLSRIGLVVLDLVLLSGSMVSFKWYLRSAC